MCPIDLFIDPESSIFTHLFNIMACSIILTRKSVIDKCIGLHRGHFDHYLQKKELCPFDHFSCARLQAGKIIYVCLFSCRNKIYISSSNVQNFNIFEVELFKLWMKLFDHVRKSSKISFSSHFYEHIILNKIFQGAEQKKYW